MRTHGQAASPTLLGKEMQFSKRLETQKANLTQIPNAARFLELLEISTLIMWLILTLIGKNLGKSLLKID